ncbi:hypothetical protein POM88_035632 [Heracleum sosnowskyi]|uniref:Ulp1 protease family, C-terminal catalytic domain-containing protein n=1 Tax=Heracleum sosnowskyi TaxID=360622 RepID=A0AAD8MBP0_9APIA|nr:hypothetical protein POM88_035632 [Heracleum sosnowskyi]
MVEFGSGRGGRLKLRKLEHKVLVVNLDSSSSIPLNSVDTNRTTDVYAGGTNMDNAITISATTNMDNAITISDSNSTPTQIKDSERGRRLKLQKLEQKVPVVVDLDSNSGIADNIVETKTTADVYACGTNLEDVIVIRSKNSTTTKKKATMIAKQIKSHGSATNMFKLNFLVLLSNFLVESNNNGYVKTDIVGFCGNIEKCSKYNWCGFVIDKLLTTHEFWAGNPSIRHFTGSLPLLTYLYLDRVSNARTQHVERTKPAYIAWTDELIKEEENYIIENNCFGKGEILEWPKRGAEEILAENWVQGHEGNHESHVHNLEEDEGAITECVGLGEDEQESDVQVCEKAICETVPSLLDENLEELLDDQKFMERFDSKLEALELLCKGCIADHGTALAMYPDHPKTTILKEKLAYIFETQFSVFEHTTKILETPIMSADVNGTCGLTDSTKKDIDKNGESERITKDETLQKQKDPENQQKHTSQTLANEGVISYFEQNVIPASEDEELDELIFMMSLEKKIDGIGNRYKSCVDGITHAAMKYPNNPKLVELKEKLSKTFSTGEKYI